MFGAQRRIRGTGNLLLQIVVLETEPQRTQKLEVTSQEAKTLEYHKGQGAVRRKMLEKYRSTGFNEPWSDSVWGSFTFQLHLKKEIF